MTERPVHCPEITMFDLLRALHYVDSKKCDLDVFLFPQSINRGHLSPILITRISTKLRVAQRVGFFDISFDYVYPVTDST